jgi:predicted DNA-binding transcriptional regulator YafY
MVARQSVVPELFDGVLSALLCGHRLQFVYRGVDGASVEGQARTVSPQTLLWYRDSWYLIAFCHDKEALRLFALSRMTALSLLPDVASVCGEHELTALLDSGYGIFAGATPKLAEVLFEPSVAPWVEPVQWHPEQQMSRCSDGRIHLTLPFNDLRELTRDLLRFAAEMEVISPPELRQAVVSAMVAGLERHQR